MIDDIYYINKWSQVGGLKEMIIYNMDVVDGKQKGMPPLTTYLGCRAHGSW